jgi:acetate kinase
LITLHLGNGASAAAIQHGRSIDTSMGFTPLEGLVMGTRCGDLDAAIPLHLENVLGQSAGELQEALNRDSGLKGLCGSNDLREVLAGEQAGDERASLALDVYCYRIRKYIGAYFVALDGLDGLIFTGGVGENAPLIRSRVCKGLEKLGIAIDSGANDRPLEEISEIGRSGYPIRILAVRTNEELQIARETISVLTG